MLVEDHTWDYRKFEGLIPSGYGASTVIVWDESTYETINWNFVSSMKIIKKTLRELIDAP